MEYPIDYPTSIRALNNKTPKGFKPVEQLDFASDFASSSDAHSILIYKGKKYNWQVKQELHIHIIEHLFLDCLEVVVYSLENMYEAPHIYLSAHGIYDRSAIHFSSMIGEIIKEYFRMNLLPPEEKRILKCLKYYLASIYIMDRMNVVSKPVFSVDVLDFEKIYRIHKSESHRQGTFSSEDNDLIYYDTLNNLKHTHSLSIPRPSALSQSAIKRTTNSSDVGEVIGCTEYRVDDILKLVVFHFMKSNRVGLSLQTQIDVKKRGNRRKHVQSIVSKTADKFGDDELLLKSLSFLHISDFLLLQAVCKRWRNLLSYGLKLFTRMYISSKFPITYPVEDMSVALSISQESDMEVVSPHASICQSVGTIEDSQDTAAAVRGEDVEVKINKDLPPLSISLVNPSTVAYLLQLNIRHITELRLDRVIINHGILENMYYLSGRLRSLSLGLVKVELSRDNNQYPYHTHLDALPYRHRGRLVAIDERRHRFLNGKDLKYILVSCGSEIRDLDVDISVGDVKNDIFSYCPNLSSLKVCGIALLKGNHSSHMEDTALSNDRDSGVCSFVIYSQGAVSVEHLTENLQGISLSNLLALLTAVTEEHSASAYRLPTASEFSSSRTATAKSRANTAHSGVSNSAESESGNLADTVTLTQVAYALVDSRGLIILVNAAWERLTGYESELAVSSTLSLLLGELSDLRELKTVVDAYRNPVPNHPAEASIFLYRKSGEVFLCQICCVPCVARRGNGRPLKQKHLSDKNILRIMEEEDEREARIAAGLATHADKGDECEDDHVYHLLRFGILSELFMPFISS